MERRRFLVVVRAGDASLHPGWIDPARSRTFDLVVSYYGADPVRYRDAPFERIDDPGQKFHGLQRLFRRESFWRDYDWIWLPDDDLATEQDAIDRMFAACEAAELDLAQPSLEWHSHYSWGVTLQSPSFALRYTDMVEVMAPCFSRGFLERALPTFDENLSGWGLSFVWPHLLGIGSRRAAILDLATVTHTRPIGGPAYDRLRAEGRDPAVERGALLVRYGLPPDVTAHVLAAIDRDGNALDLAWPPDAGRLQRKCTRDSVRFAEARQRYEPASLGRRPAPATIPGVGLDGLREAARRMRAAVPLAEEPRSCA